MLKRIFVTTLLVAPLLMIGLGQAGEGTGSSRYNSGNITNVQWSTDSRREGETEITTRTLQSLKGRGAQALVIEEERRTQTGPDTWRITRTTYNLDSRGRKKPIEIVEAEERRVGEEGYEINRTVSTPNSSGRFRVIRQEVETSETTPSGKTASTMVYRPDINGGMEAVQLIQTREIVRPTGETEIQQTASSVSGQGQWVATEQKIHVITADEEGLPVTEWQQTFRPNSRGKLSLSEQTRTNYTRSPDGSEEWEVETETAPRGDGRLSLSRRVKTSRKVLDSGGEEMVQEVESLRPGQRSEGLALTERTITRTRPASESETEVTVEVQARSANGGFRTVSQSSLNVPAQKKEESAEPERNTEVPPPGS